MKPNKLRALNDLVKRGYLKKKDQKYFFQAGNLFCELEVNFYKTEDLGLLETLSLDFKGKMSSEETLARFVHVRKNRRAIQNYSLKIDGDFSIISAPITSMSGSQGLALVSAPITSMDGPQGLASRMKTDLKRVNYVLVLGTDYSLNKHDSVRVIVKNEEPFQDALDVTGRIRIIPRELKFVNSFFSEHQRYVR